MAKHELSHIVPDNDAGPKQEPGPVLDTIWKACAYGDFERLREFVTTNPSLVNTPDEQGAHPPTHPSSHLPHRTTAGYFPVQWAALNNRVAVITYLTEHGCNVNGADSTGQTALHWAAVRGSLSAAETLLRAGADLNAKDCR